MENDIRREPLADKVLERIEEERVVPKPRWQFDLADRLFWFVGAACLVLGMLVAAGVLFRFANAGWEFEPVTHGNFIEFFSQIVPAIWLVVLVGVVILAYENFRRTKHGYRSTLATVIGLSLLSALLGGALLYAAGVGQVVEEDIGGRIPAYQPVLKHQQVVWMHPERGLLAGELVSISPDITTFRLRSFDGKEWQLNGTSMSPRSWDTLQRFRVVRIVGLVRPTTTEDMVFFEPCFVFPWKIRGAWEDPRVPSKELFHAQIKTAFDEPLGEDCRTLHPYPVLKKLQE